MNYQNRFRFQGGGQNFLRCDLFTDPANVVFCLRSQMEGALPRGIRNVNRVSSGVDVTSIRPPCACAI
jgi:hypothetical protein